MTFLDIPATTPEIGQAVEAYKQKWGLPASAYPLAKQWVGVFHNGQIVLVVGEDRSVANYTEVTDMYSVPGHSKYVVAKAVRTVLSVYKDAYNQGVHFVVRCLWVNTDMQRAIKKMFDLDPRQVVYLT